MAIYGRYPVRNPLRAAEALIALGVRAVVACVRGVSNEWLADFAEDRGSKSCGSRSSASCGPSSCMRSGERMNSSLERWQGQANSRVHPRRSLQTLGDCSILPKAVPWEIVADFQELH